MAEHSATKATEDVDLPKYSPAEPASNARNEVGCRDAGQTTHVSALKNTKGRAWLKLSVRSRAPDASSLPVLREGDEVHGTVAVDLEQPESCKGIIVAVTGECTAVGQEPVNFLNMSDSNAKGDAVQYDLPPTFTERASPAYIDYKIVVNFKRPLLRVNQTLSSSFGYTPRWIAPAPTALRMIAYREGGLLVGPDGDPDGWEKVEVPLINGKLFESQPIEIEAMLFISKPTSYANASPIHLHLILKGSNTQALDLLSLPAAPRVALTRTISIGTTATDDTAPRRSNNTFPEHIAKAHWWPIAEGAPEDNVRILRGEIDVPRNAKPSFLFPRFSLRYHISVLPFSAPGYAPSSPDQLASAKVTIVTENAPGVIPRSHAPPGYEKEQQGNWNTSMGYLENGNQRFYHHHMR